MQLHRDAPDPLYIQIKDLLCAEIDAGHYHPHQRLPSERELSQRFNVGRMTVRQALLGLMRAGRTYTVVGKGTFVAEDKIDQQLRTLTGFSQEMCARGGQPGSIVLEARQLPASPEAARALHLPPGASVISLRRLRICDGIPLAIEHAILPQALFPSLLQHDFSVQSLYHVLETQYGQRLTQAEQSMEAALASPQELELLALRPPAAVLKMQRLTFNQNEVPVEYVFSVYRGDRYKLRSLLHARNSL